MTSLPSLDLVELELLDSPAEPAFDRLTELVRRVLSVPVALISIIDGDRQFFKSHQGLAEPWCSLRETPLSHSFCQHVVAGNAPLVVSDARETPIVQDNLAIRDLNVVAYLGAPVRTPEGTPIGSLCAIDSVPRTWSARDQEAIEALAEAVSAEIAARQHLRERDAAEAALRDSKDHLERRVDERTAQVRALSRALTLAEQKERQRIAHVLHDDIQQVLYGAQIRASLGDVDGLQDLLERASHLTRSLAHELVPPALEGQRLVDLLDWLKARKQELYGLEVHVEVRDDVEVAEPHIWVLLYGLLREVLFNVSKHAGVGQARVLAENAQGPSGDGSLRVVVEDDGAGFDPRALGDPEARFGLASVRERLALVGGRLTVTSEPGVGTRVEMEIPMSPVL